MWRYVAPSLHTYHMYIYTYSTTYDTCAYQVCRFGSNVRRQGHPGNSGSGGRVDPILYYNVILYYAIHYDDDVTRDGGFIFFPVVSTRAHTRTI